MSRLPPDEGATQGPLGRVKQFELLEELGRGGMGVVFRARDTVLGRYVALKRPHREKLKDPATRERFLREAKTASRLSHAHIIPIHEILEADGLPWLAMDLVTGSCLREMLHDQGPPQVQDILRYAEGLTDALRVAHKHHVLHRDITPNNIFINGEGQALLGDFGLATWFLAPGDTSIASTATTVLTATGGVVGTNGYMSPEQSLGRAVDPRSDLFSLGTVLYEMCSGKAAFAGHSAPAVLDALLHNEPPPLRTVNPRIPRELESIISRAMAKQPEDRYPSAAAMLEDIRRLRRRHDYESSDDHRPIWRDTSLFASPYARWIVGPAVLIMIALIAWWAPGITAWLAGSIPQSAQPPALVPIQASMRPLVTWPSDESDSRLSPDGRWVSFLSDRGGDPDIWVQSVRGSHPNQLTHAQGPVYSHVWSPSGDEIAYLVGAEGRVYLHVVPAPLGGPPRANHVLSTSAHRLVRWNPEGLYLEADGRLMRMDITTGVMQAAFVAGGALEFSRQFDVDLSGREVVFSGVARGQENLWHASLAGGEARPLRSDGDTARWPLWTADGAVLYASNRSGPLGLWLLQGDQAEPVQFPLNQRVERPLSLSRDGSMLTVEVERKESDIWFWDEARRETTPLTADTMEDFQPSLAAGHMVFQRAKPVQENATSFFDARLMRTSFSLEGSWDEVLLEDSGYAPQLSPDGRWLAFLRISKRPPSYNELWLKDLKTLQSHRLAENFYMAGLKSHPRSLMGHTLTWSAAGPVLYYVTLEDDGRHDRTWLVEPGKDLTPVALPMDLPEGTRLSHLRLDAQGHVNLLAARRHDSDRIDYRILSFDGNEPAGEQLYQETLPQGQQLSPLGWLDSRRMIILRSRLTPQRDHQVSLLEVRPGSAPVREVASVEHAFPSTAMLDPAHGRVYLTIADGAVHHGLLIRLADGSASRFTGTNLPGVTFADYRIVEDRGIVFVRQQTNNDIWLVQTDRQVEIR